MIGFYFFLYLDNSYDNQPQSGRNKLAYGEAVGGLKKKLHQAPTVRNIFPEK